MLYEQTDNRSLGVQLKTLIIAAGIAVLAASLLAPTTARAGDITFTADTTFTVETPSVNLVIENGSDADSVTVNPTNVVIVVSGGDTLTLHSVGNVRLINDGAYSECSKVGGNPTITLTAGTTTITPTGTKCSSGDSGGSVGVSPADRTYTATVLSPNGGESFAAGASVDITYSTGGTGTTSAVSLYYTTDGSLYKEIAKYLTNSGVYHWTVPDVTTALARIKIEGTDTASVLASDISDAAFTITGTKPLITTPEETKQAQMMSDEELGITRDAEGRRTAPLTNTTGKSPITGLDEAISEVHEGQFVRAYGFDTIYYIDEGMVRRPFWNATTYFTWANAWDEAVWVTNATLTTMPLGAPMIPKPGVVLVKIQSDANVYAVEMHSDGAYALNLLPSEAVAQDIYGNSWADYVIDIEPTLMSRYVAGENMQEGDTVDLSIMKTRTQIANLVAGSN